MATRYQTAMKESAIEFTSAIQSSVLDAILRSQSPQKFEVYFIATDPTHVHLLVGWRDNRTWLRMRSTIKGSITRWLNQRIGRREWFSEGGSRKRVKDRSHFEYLKSKYLPNHRGWKWSREKGNHV